METETKKIGFGLQQLPDDPRDFSQEIVFGATPFSELPQTDFFVSEPLGIKNQKATDFCAGFAAAEVSEDQEAVELNGEFSFQAAKKLLRDKKPDAWKDYGLNLREVCQAACKIGFLEQEYYPFEYREDVDRDFLANPANWPDDLEALAHEHKKASFFAVDGPYDRFDNFRSVMHKKRSENRSILTGVLWRYSWNSAPGGVIPRTGWENDKGEGHAIKIFGQMWMDDVDVPGERTLYLVAVNSWGPNVGDGGIFYFPKEVINKEFNFGAYTFEDLPADYAKYHNENGLRVNATPLEKLLKVFWNFFLEVLRIKK